MIDNDAAVAPTITGTVAGQTTSADAAVAPFSGVTIADPNSGATDTLTITLSDGANGTLTGTGLINDGGGVYTLAAASPATISSELDALVFTPTAGAPGSSTHHHLHAERRQQRRRHRHRQQHHHGDRHRSGGGADHHRNGGRQTTISDARSTRSPA